MNPFYHSFQQNRQPQQGNGYGPAPSFDLNTALQNLARQIMPTGMTPEQIVRQKIQNGEMSMQQFQQYSAMADQVIQTLYGTGRRY